MGAVWAVYSRVSRVGDRADTLISPDLQIQRATGYAASRQLTIEVLDPELDVSGAATERPILSEAMAGVESGRFAGIIVAQLDRLSRMDLVDALHTIERVESAGGQVIAVAENFDAGTPEGRLGRNVFLAMGQMQLDRYKLQFRAAKAQAVARGIWPIPVVPLGYRKRADRHLEPAGDAAKVRRAFRTRAAGAPWSQVAQTLGVGVSGAQKIVRNPVYLGHIVYGEWSNPKAHEPIVDRATWEAAQLDHPRPARRAGQPALLGGLVRCAGCQAKMTPTTNKGGAERTYRCVASNKAGGRCGAPAIISQAKLDRYVEGLALGEIERLAITADRRTDQLDKAQAELEAAEAELAAYQEAVRVTDIGGAAFAAGMRSRHRTVEDARALVARTRMTAVSVPAPGTLAELWPGLSVAERRHVLGGALSVVFVAKGSGPCEGRVRVVAAGHTPRPGRGRLPLVALGDEHLPGEIGPAGAEHVE